MGSNRDGRCQQCHRFTKVDDVEFGFEPQMKSPFGLYRRDDRRRPVRLMARSAILKWWFYRSEGTDVNQLCKPCQKGMGILE